LVIVVVDKTRADSLFGCPAATTFLAVYPTIGLTKRGQLDGTARADA
jgi:hypothetical protein